MMSMDEPIVVTITHKLGRDEAKRRVERGFGTMQREIGQYAGAFESHWEGYQLDFHASALMQTITGRLDVFDDSIRIELGLPRLLQMFAKTIAGRLESSGHKLLEGPQSKA